MNRELYSLRFHPAVKKDLRKLPHQAAQYFIKEAFPALILDPQRGGILRGSFRHLRKQAVHYEGVSYRIIYQFDSRNHSVVVVMVGPRGDFYERLRQRLG